MKIFHICVCNIRLLHVLMCVQVWEFFYIYVRGECVDVNVDIYALVRYEIAIS